MDGLGKIVSHSPHKQEDLCSVPQTYVIKARYDGMSFLFQSWGVER